MGILSWIIVGLLAGWIAGMIMKGSGYGVVGNIVVGIVGALLGGFLSTTLFDGVSLSGFNLQSLLIAILGSIVLIFLVRLLPGRSPL
jgi:uncharacterized membrane protein YeaQ/YmgE (transglycosylase-associated protein family)